MRAVVQRVTQASVAIGGEKPAAVAADYGLTRNAVDQIRHRVATRLRALAETLASAGD